MLRTVDLLSLNRHYPPMTIEIQAIHAFKDNYIWLLVNPNTHTAVCVDPGDGDAVLQTLHEQGLQLSAILITHHHWDHTNGIATLLVRYPVRVYGPKNEAIAGVTHTLQQGDTIQLDDLDLNFTIFDIPGHTLGHIAYYGDNKLFCGDTLFAAGCGRLFEGSPQQMLDSLNKLQQLPADTLVYCAHEYTLSNLRFAQTVEPNNPDINKRLQQTKRQRAAQQITLPSTISLESQTNPFLRCHLPSVQQAASNYSQQTLNDPVDVFAAIRVWKDNYA